MASSSGVRLRLIMIGAAFAVQIECATVPAQANSIGTITADDDFVK